MHEGQVEVPRHALAAAVATQFPELAGSEVVPVESAGTVIAPLRPGGASWSGNGRGGQPLTSTEWVRTSIQRGAHLTDPVAATRVWESALDAPAHQGAPVSINGVRCRETS